MALRTKMFVRTSVWVQRRYAHDIMLAVSLAGTQLYIEVILSVEIELTDMSSERNAPILQSTGHCLFYLENRFIWKTWHKIDKRY